MLKIYVLSAFLVGFNASYSMEPAKEKSEIGLILAHAADYAEIIQSIQQSAQASEYAQLFNDPKFIDSLIQKISNRFGKDPEEVARDINTLGAQLWLTHIRPNQLKLVDAAKTGDLATVRELIIAGVNVNARNYTGWTALMTAAYKGRLEVVKILIAAGANVNINDEHSNTALTLTVQQGETEVLKELIAGGANVNAQDRNGWTALMVAAYNGHTEIVKTLIKAGADVNAYDKNSYTVLMNAVIHRDTEIVKELIAAGADVNAQNIFGKTALNYARQQNNKDIIELLEKATKK